MNCKLNNLFFVLLFLLVTHFSTAQNFNWALGAGGIKSDKCTSIAKDDSNYVYASGYFSAGMSIGNNNVNVAIVANATSKEIWHAKFNPSGSCVWAISGGEYFDDRILGMGADAQGNTVVTGTFWQTSVGMNLNGYSIAGPPGTGGDQCFVFKVSPSGTVLWGKSFASNSGDDQGMDACFANNGDIYVCGFMTGNYLKTGTDTVAINTTTGNYEYPYWLVKMDAAGNVQWGKTFGNLPYDTSHFKYIERDIAICSDENNNVYVTGGFDHTRDFDGQNLTSNGSYDGFVISYDNAGNKRYAKNFGSRKEDWANGICSDGNGSIYIVGEHRDSLYYDGQFVAKNYDKRDAYAIKIDASNGNAIWAARAGSNNGGERANDVVADKNCNVYVCGDIYEGAKFGDNIIIPAGDSTQSFVARISTDGKWKWASTGGSFDNNDRANDLALLSSGNIITGGFYRVSASFGANNIASNGKSDIWLASINDATFNTAYDFDLKKPDNLEYCLGDSTILNLPIYDSIDFSPKGEAYLSTDGKQIIFKPSTTTNFKVWGSLGNICIARDTIDFTIIVHPIPIADFDLPAIQNFKNPTITLINKSINATNYEWYQQTTFLANSQDLNFTAPTPDEFCFELKASSAFGCRDSVTKCISFFKNGHLAFPNAFTPNKDNLNNIFRPIFIDVNENEIQHYVLQIFNRWGERVFQSHNVNNGWNGSYLGEAQPLSTYHYICTYNIDDKEFKQIGDLTLIK